MSERTEVSFDAALMMALRADNEMNINAFENYYGRDNC